MWGRWSPRRPVKAQIAGSSPVTAAMRPSSKGQGTRLRIWQSGFDSSWAYSRPASSTGERLPYKQRVRGSSPWLATMVAEAKVAEALGREPSHREFESPRSPQGRVAQRRLRPAVNRVTHTEVRVLPRPLSPR